MVTVDVPTVAELPAVRVSTLDPVAGFVPNDAVTSAGYVPYRAGSLSMDRLGENSEVFWDVVATLKAALDPQHRFSPGHYEPARVD